MDTNQLRTLLKIEDIPLDKFSDEELETLITSKTLELEGLTGLDITPHYRKDTISHFKGKTCALNFYPVRKIGAIKYNDKCLHHHDYKINDDLGVIYFKEHLTGFLQVEYISGLTDENISSLINPLLKEMIAYSLTYNKWGMGDAVSSIREGDVSVNYDTGNGRGAVIWNRINDLKTRFTSTRIRWL